MAYPKITKNKAANDTSLKKQVIDYCEEKIKVLRHEILHTSKSVKSYHVLLKAKIDAYGDVILFLNADSEK